jgi:Cys-tRNA(Pro)/Cys-tRNA(Cys) deacylase
VQKMYGESLKKSISRAQREAPDGSKKATRRNGADSTTQYQLATRRHLRGALADTASAWNRQWKSSILRPGEAPHLQTGSGPLVRLRLTPRAWSEKKLRNVMKTNATRYLDGLGIAYELREYAVDEDDLGAIKVADQIGLPADQVFKTVVARGDLSGVVLAVVPGNRELDLKALARLSGNRTMELVRINLLRQLTGYIRGGVTAFACKRKYPVYVDSSISNHDVIAVSAGVRGTQMLLAPNDYIKSASAVTGQIARPASVF